MRLPTPLRISLFLLAASPLRAAPDPAKALTDFLAAEWEYTMQQSPVWASNLGDRRFNDRWDDQSRAAIAARHEHDSATLKRLATIPRDQLPAADQLNYDLYELDLKNRIEGYRFRFYLMPVNQREGPQTADDTAASLRFETVKDYEDWIARLQKFPDVLAQSTDLMREGAGAQGRVHVGVCGRFVADASAAAGGGALHPEAVSLGRAGYARARSARCAPGGGRPRGVAAGGGVQPRTEDSGLRGAANCASAGTLPHPPSGRLLPLGEGEWLSMDAGISSHALSRRFSVLGARIRAR